MNQLFLPFEIPNFKSIQHELFSSVDPERLTRGTHAFNHTEEQMLKNCPLFMNWFVPRNKSKVRLFRFYITEAKGHLGPHIDGLMKLRVPFGMNIPLLNCENTYHTYFDCDEDNLQNEYKSGYLAGVTPKDTSKIKEIEKRELTGPCFLRNDIIHSVINNNDKPRVMFTVRWELHPTRCREIEEVFDVS